MSSAADVEIWDNACQEFDKSSFDEAVRLFNSMGTISSKISFNVGSVYLAKDNIKDALKNFQDSVKKDAHLALGYYMSGLCYYKQSRYNHADEQFEQTLKCMRGNKCVDYKQLGLKFQLYECEVLMNQAAVHSKLDDTNKAKCLLSLATEVKADKRHDVVQQSLQFVQAGRALEPFLPPSGLIFRPSAQAVKNVKKQDYLGQAKVLYSADPKDNTARFSGLKLLEDTREKVLADIRKPGRKESLTPLSESEDARIRAKPRPAPPRKALPTKPTEARDRVQTWAGSKPSKPLPRSPLPVPPTRPSVSPSMSKGWDGQKSSTSAFIEKSNSSASPLPPRKPLPSFPVSQINGTNGHTGNGIDVEVQFNFSVTMKCDSNTTLDDLRKDISQQTIPKSVAIMYVDKFGKERKLTESSLSYILQGVFEQPKIVCTSSYTV